MQKNILNYRITIEKEKKEKRGFVYNAYCPALQLADFGTSIDQAVKRMTNLIKFHLESLEKLGYPIPVEKESTTIITSYENNFIYGYFN